MDAIHRAAFLESATEEYQEIYLSILTALAEGKNLRAIADHFENKTFESDSRIEIQPNSLFMILINIVDGVIKSISLHYLDLNDTSLLRLDNIDRIFALM
jgi:hypothetical protein